MIALLLRADSAVALPLGDLVPARREDGRQGGGAGMPVRCQRQDVVVQICYCLPLNGVPGTIAVSVNGPVSSTTVYPGGTSNKAGSGSPNLI